MSICSASRFMIWHYKPLPIKCRSYDKFVARSNEILKLLAKIK